MTVLGRAGSFPAPGEATSGFLLSTDTTHVLIDCGAGVLSQLLRVLPMTALDAVLITHRHPDHISDLTVLPHLVRFVRWQALPEHRRDPLPLYLPPAPPNDRYPIPVDESLQWIRFGEEEGDVAWTIGDMEFVLRRVVHPIPTFGVRAFHQGKVWVYTADTAPDPAVTSLARDADLLVCEASMTSDQAELAALAGHMTGSDAGRLAREAGVGRLLLTHLVMGVKLQALLEEVGRQASGVPFAPAEPLQTYAIGRDEGPDGSRQGS